MKQRATPSPLTLPTDNLRVYQLRNQQGASATVLNLGARLTSLNIPSRAGELINTVLGYKHTRDYLTDSMYHGAIAGRYCNRIAKSEFQLNGQRYQLPANDGAHHLHGGIKGFHQQLWEAIEIGPQRLHLQHRSKDGEEGYPGELTVDVIYELDDQNCLSLNWFASSDRDTVISLTNHSYFNLSGSADIYNHYLRIHADHYTPVDNEQIPDGRIEPVAKTAFDLRRWSRLGRIIDSNTEEIMSNNGLDHNWARGHNGQLKPSADLYSPDSELLLKISSTLPGIQCYTGNALINNSGHNTHQGICLETQHYPNTPNQPLFPSARLNAGEQVQHQTNFTFSTAEEKHLFNKY